MRKNSIGATHVRQTEKNECQKSQDEQVIVIRNTLIKEFSLPPNLIGTSDIRGFEEFDGVRSRADDSNQ